MKLDLSEHLEFFISTYDDLNCYDSCNEYLDKIDELSDEALKCIYLIYFFYKFKSYYKIYTKYTACSERIYKNWDYFYETVYRSPNNKLSFYFYKNMSCLPGLIVEKSSLRHLHLNGMILPVDKYMNERLHDLSYLEMLYRHIDFFIVHGKAKMRI